MSTLLNNLINARNSVAAKIAALEADSTEAGGKPNVPGSADHVGYAESLYKRLAMLDKQIATHQAGATVEVIGIPR